MAHRRQDSPRNEPWFDRLRLTNVPCFEDTVVPLDRRVTVILGEDGAGKTTIAEALASLSFGEDEGLKAFPSRRDGGAGQIALFEEQNTGQTAESNSRGAPAAPEPSWRRAAPSDPQIRC